MPSPLSNNVYAVLAFDNSIVHVEFKVFLLEYPAYAINRTISGVTRGLSQGRQSLAEGDPLAKTQKKVNDSESLDVVDVCTT